MSKQVRVGIRYFTAARIEKLRAAWCDSAVSMDRCAEILNVPRGSIYSYAKRLGFGPRPKRTNLKCERHWSAAEDKYLFENADKLTREEMMRHIGCGRKSLEKHLKALGLAETVPVRFKAPKEPRAPRQPKPKSAPRAFRFDRCDFSPRKPLVEIRGDVPVRRFEMGCSALGTDFFMRDAGFDVKAEGPNMFKVKRAGAPGKPQRVSRQQLIELMDQERVARGLEPVVKR